MSLTIQRLSGQQLSVSVPASDSIASLHVAVHAALGLGRGQAIKLTKGVIPLEPQFAGGATLLTYGIEDGDALSVAILRQLCIHRHVYRAGGGAPPYRYGNLVSTEEVLLDPALSISEQWGTLAVGDSVYLMTTTEDERCSYCDGDGSGGQCPNCGGGGSLICAPRLWCEADRDERELLPYDERTAGEVFQERNAIGCLHQMRGVD